MRTTAVKTTALALLLGGAALTWGQQAPPDPLLTKRPAEEKAPAKSKLEEMLARALKDNPDIRVAAAKLGEAEAELNRVRLRVMQKVVTLYHSIEMARTDVSTAERALARTMQLNKQRVVSSDEVAAAEAALAAAKAKLAAVEAEVPYVTGKQPQTADAAAQRGLMYLSRLQVAGTHPGYSTTLSLQALAAMGAGPAPASRPVQGPVAEGIRKALDLPVSLRVADAPVGDVLKLLREKEPTLNIKFVPTSRAAAKNNDLRVSMDARDLPLGAALEELEDSLPDYTIVVREYGLLITRADRVPPGAVPLHEFWKKSRGPAAAGAGKNPPAQEVEGVVKKVDASGLLTISVGSDAGLVKGNTLEVFRIASVPSQSKYLGTIRIVEAGPKSAVGQPVGRLIGTPQPGDRVASRILEK